MGKKIRFPLKLSEGAEVRTLEELREHFDLQAILGYYKSGKLLTWLEDRYLEGEAEAIRALDETAPDFQRKLCGIFQAEYAGGDVDLEAIERRQERLKRLRSITDEAEYIQNIDSVAFDQEELADLLDEGVTRIYLCGDKFTVPASRKGITYIGIKNPAVHISGKVPEDTAEMGIEFVGITCDNLPLITTDDAIEIMASTEPIGPTELSEARANEIFDLLFVEQNGAKHRGILCETDHYLLVWEESASGKTFDAQYGAVGKLVLRFKALNKRTLAFMDLPDLRDFSVAKRRATFASKGLIGFMAFMIGKNDETQVPPSYVYGDIIYMEKLGGEPAVWTLSLATGELNEFMTGIN